ncbi:acid phosphatase/Vanadium-dependent haloperoxidase [Coemansia reversa NRRL 1564]|uniref:Acid phosphatase/Vanadium-dependent haloperoxidase n=1 Tax=Coemansia reversa (strain ATCC 12441 / NRRL 1564) TaxID=763665 RepID=A0A2G5B6Z7_COERN|nr:acid phosphatase/Vanadium-dependent haloperoxidase [Coemansia reversa NRRL 1564]|eukprot:PIA14771.1 acid phosphatase/Vanadium-dependent haloperoxidase [Coemansia reversa NRRL 1564]
MPSLWWERLSFRIPASLVRSYVPDWIVTLASTLIWLYLGVAKPHYQPFSVNDKSISYPYVPPNKQTVTNPMLFAASIFAPACIIVVFALGLRRSAHDLHVGLLGLLMGVSLTLMFTNCLKNVVGRPRPSLLARCLPKHSGAPLSDPPQGLSTVDICTQDDIGVLNEGFRSFPSGHTSLAFAGMTYLMYFIAGKLHLFDRQGHTYKSFAVLMPLLIAATIGATRVADYWHHPTDVFVGAAIGICTATFSYHQYYPLLVVSACDAPYDPRKSPEPLLPLYAHHIHLANTGSNQPEPRAPYARSASTSSLPGLAVQ